MCGIVGVLQYKSEVPREIRHRALKVLFSQTMLQTEIRGVDATGLYQVHRDGDWAMTKKGRRVSDWMFQSEADAKEDPVVYADFMNSWSEHKSELSALIGHCRKATIGSKGRDNNDNHPFAVQIDSRHAILGVHNGTLVNHETIFKKMPELLKRQGSVDSEAIFHLMFHLSEYGTKPWDEAMLKKLGGRLDGAYACIVVNSKIPNQVATFRDGRPMEFFLISPLNIVVICSERKFVIEALEGYEFIRRISDPSLPFLRTYDRVLPDRDYRIFDTSLEFPGEAPSYQHLDKISSGAAIKNFNTEVEEGWGTPSTKEEGSKPGKVANAAKPNVGVKTSKSNAANPTGGAIKAIPARTGAAAEEEVVIVDIEVEGDGDGAKEAYQRARTMGICSNFDIDSELAKALGMSLEELIALDRVELANKIARDHWNFGFASSRFETRTEIGEIRSAGQKLTRRLDRAEAKKKKAEARIWELKQLIAILLALGKSKFALSERNISISLDALEKLSEERRKQILHQAEDILRDERVQRGVSQLREEYRQSEARRARRGRRAHTLED